MNTESHKVATSSVTGALSVKTSDCTQWYTGLLHCYVLLLLLQQSSVSQGAGWGEGNWTCYTAPFPSGPHPPWVCNTGFLYQNMCVISCFYSGCISARLTFLMLYTHCVHPCSLSMGVGFTQTGIVFLPIKIKYVHFTNVPLCFIAFYNFWRLHSVLAC